MGDANTEASTQKKGNGRRRRPRGHVQEDPNVERPSQKENALETAQVGSAGPDDPKGKAIQMPDVDADDAEVCFICASNVIYTAVAPCNHRTCHICALRLRALYKSRACAHCRVSRVSYISCPCPSADTLPNLYRRVQNALVQSSTSFSALMLVIWWSLMSQMDFLHCMYWLSRWENHMP